MDKDKAKRTKRISDRGKSALMQPGSGDNCIGGGWL